MDYPLRRKTPLLLRGINATSWRLLAVGRGNKKGVIITELLLFRECYLMVGFF